MAAVQSARNDRIKAAIATGAIQAALALALIAGLQVSRHAAVPDALVLVDLPPETPPPLEKIEPRTADSRAKRSRPSPPNIKSRATEIVAPPPILALALPTPVIAAPVAGFGADRAAGAAPLPGPGTGIGGKGWGDGGGGDGDGLGRGRGTPPRRVRGHIGNGDYPRWAGEAGIGGTVSVRYAVEIDGRVSGCVVTRSSGDAALDEFTCGLIVKRFRFKPSLEASGRPVRSYIVENHDWTIEIDPDPPPEDGR
jgi:protein TonB